MKRARPFILCFEAHRSDGNVWAVQQARRWTLAPAVDVRVPTVTVYRGRDVEQPRAYLQGVGVVRKEPYGLVITAA